MNASLPHKVVESSEVIPQPPLQASHTLSSDASHRTFIPTLLPALLCSSGHMQAS